MSSCTQTTSASWLGSQSKKPLVAAERMPLRLADIIRIRLIFKKLEKMSDYKAEFVEFAIASNVLCFGEFKTKAGRHEPLLF